MEFLIMVHIFSIFLLELEIYCLDKFQNYVYEPIGFFRAMYFWNKLPNQIKNSNSVENLKIKLDDF